MLWRPWSTNCVKSAPDGELFPQWEERRAVSCRKQLLRASDRHDFGQSAKPASFPPTQPDIEGARRTVARYPRRAGTTGNRPEQAAPQGYRQQGRRGRAERKRPCCHAITDSGAWHGKAVCPGLRRLHETGFQFLTKYETHDQPSPVFLISHRRGSAAYTPPSETQPSRYKGFFGLALNPRENSGRSVSADVAPVAGCGATESGRSGFDCRTGHGVVGGVGRVG